MNCDYLRIVSECESDLERFGDTFQGVGWTKRKEYAELRYRIMLDGIRPSFPRPIKLLDFGCGCAHLLDFIIEKKVEGLRYYGLDLSDKYLEVCRQKHPATTFYKLNVLEGSNLPMFDYIVLNGIFTYRGTNSYGDMLSYFKSVLLAVARSARLGFAFNVMTKYLDWERDDLFHLPIDTVASFLNDEIGRAFTVRHDYGLYEYTVYVYSRDLSSEL